jgi:hypothetical protein
LCGASLPAGTKAIYESQTKTIRCLDCATEAAAKPWTLTWNHLTDHWWNLLHKPDSRLILGDT